MPDTNKNFLLVTNADVILCHICFLEALNEQDEGTFCDRVLKQGTCSHCGYEEKS